MSSTHARIYFTLAAASLLVALVIGATPIFSLAAMALTIYKL